MARGCDVGIVSAVVDRRRLPVLLGVGCDDMLLALAVFELFDFVGLGGCEACFAVALVVAPVKAGVASCLCVWQCCSLPGP